MAKKSFDELLKETKNESGTSKKSFEDILKESGYKTTTTTSKTTANKTQTSTKPSTTVSPKEWAESKKSYNSVPNYYGNQTQKSATDLRVDSAQKKKQEEEKKTQTKQTTTIEETSKKTVASIYDKNAVPSTEEAMKGLEGTTYDANDWINDYTNRKNKEWVEASATHLKAESDVSDEELARQKQLYEQERKDFLDARGGEVGYFLDVVGEAAGRDNGVLSEDRKLADIQRDIDEIKTEQNLRYTNKFYGMTEEQKTLVATVNGYEQGLGISKEMYDQAISTLKSKYRMSDDDIKINAFYWNRYANKNKAKDEEIRDRVWAENNPFVSSVLSVPQNLVGGVSSVIGGAVGAIENKKMMELGMPDPSLDPYSKWTRMQRQAQTSRDEWQANHDLMVGNYDVGDLLYSVALSTAESLVASQVPGGAALLGISAGSSAMMDSAKKGFSTTQSIADGIAIALFEGIFESFSIGNINALKEVNPNTFADVLKNIGKSMGVNFSEEALTEAATKIYDGVAHGDLSEHSLRVQELMSQGVPYEEAINKATLEDIWGVVEAGVSGLMMGAAIGSVGSTSAYVKNRNINTAIGKKIRESGAAGDVVNVARNNEYGDKEVQEWVNRINKTDKTTGETNVPDHILGGAFRAMAEAESKNRKESTVETEQTEEITPEQRVEMVRPTLERKDGKVVSVESVESVEDGKITVKGTDGKSRVLDTSKLSKQAQELWNYAAEHFTDAETVQAFVDGYEGSDIATYSRVFKATNDLAATGMSATDIQKRNMIDTSVLGKKAFSSAVETGNRAINKKIGVVDRTTVPKTNTQKLTIKMMDTFSKKHGMNIVVVDTLGTTEGWYKPSTNSMVIALDSSAGAISRVFGHETYHYVKSQDKVRAKQIEEFVIDTMTRLKGKEWVESKINSYDDSVYDTYELKVDEFVADQMFDVFNNERAVKEFVQKDMNFAQKVIAHIKSLIADIKNIYNNLISRGYDEISVWQKDIDALQKLNDMMLDALSNIEQRKNTGQKAEKNTSDEVMNSTKRDTEITRADIDTLRGIGRKSINEFTSQDLSKAEKWAVKFYKELGIKSPFFRAWFGDWRANDNQKVTKVTVNTKNIKPSDIPRTGTKNLDTGWNVNVSGKGIEKTASQQKKWSLEYHSLSSINLMLENAILFDTVVVDKPSKKLGENVAFLHHMYVPIIADGNEMVAKLYVTEEIGDEHKFYLIKTEAVLSDSRGDSNKASRQFSSDKTASMNTVADLFDFVKKRTADFERDSDNPILFHPKPASKIVNADGTPKVMYHGTQNDFTVFDKKKAKSSGYYGKGFYFTDSESHAQQYGNSMAVYLDVKNPLEQGKNHISKKQLRKFLEAVAENEDDYDIWNYGTEDISEIIDSIYKEDAFAVIQDVNATAIGDFAEAIALFNKVNGTNYDGVITPTETVVYKPTQIKSATNNIGTFDKDNPDIRFSTKRSVEETKDLIAVHNMQESELLKTLQLGGFPMPSIAIIKAQQGHSEYGPVSVVFNKSTIDPSANKYNKVYGGDAWTPTYPTIEYKVNDKVQEKISNLYYELYRKYGADEARPLYNYVNDMERQLNTNRGEAGMIENLKDDERLMQLYLLQSGKGKVEPVIKQTVTELSEADVEMYDYLISAIGKDVISEFKTPFGKKPLQYRTEFYEKNGEKIETAYKQMLRDNFGFTEEQIDNVISNMRKGDFVNLIRQTYQYMVNGKTTIKEEIDGKATSEAIRNAIKDSGFNQWVDDLFKGVEEKSGIRNNADYFTSSGNRRSWEALHWENTLENVVKVMKSQNNGVAAFFSGHAIWGVSAKDYKSVDELKADSDRLKKLPQEEYDAIKEGFGMRLNEIATSIMDKSESNQFIAADNAMQCIVEAVRNSKTKSGILNELKQYRQLDVTETAVDDIVSLVSDISNMPTEYFEAKPQRAVGLDEIAYVVVPDTSTELVNTLNERGIKTRTYTAGDEADRVRALNSDESVLFSTKRDSSISEDASNYILNTKEYQEVLSILDERMNLVAHKNLSPKAINYLAGKLLNKVKSNYSREQLTERLTALFDYIANSRDVSWEEITEIAAQISKDVLKESSVLDRSRQKEYADVLKLMKETKVYISPEQKAEIKMWYGSYDAFRRLVGNKIGVTVTDTSAVPLDVFWRELSENRPEMFNAETNYLDMPAELVTFFEMTSPQYINPYDGVEMDMDEASYDMALQIYDEYFNIPEVKTEAQKYALKEERLKGRYNAKIKDIHNTYRERIKKLRKEKNNKIEATKALYRQRHEDYRDKRNETDEKQKLRRQIVRETKKLTDMLVNPTDKKHIPQELIIGINSFARAMTEHGAFPAQRAVKLQQAFKNIGEKATDPDFNLASMYDDDIDAMLNELTSVLSDKKLGEMNSSELKKVRDIAKYFSHIVSMSNKAFSENIRENLSTLQTETLNEVESQNKDKKRMMTKMQVGLLKPVTFFELLESPTLDKLYTNIRKGEESWAKIVYEAKQKRIEAQKEYNYKEWADDKVEITTERENKLSLTVKEALSIYALSKRNQGADHIMVGGIVLEEEARKRLNKKNRFSKNKDKSVNVRSANVPLSFNDIQRVNSMLTDEQKAYADELVKYMSSDMAKLGNEVSMRLYGIQKYTENYYFPIKSASNFLYSEPGVENDSRIKHMSMTKRTVPKANNPVIIGDFTETVMSHCQDMALYYGFTLPLEDFKRVWNYKTPTIEGETPTSIKQQLDMVYGDKANKYIKQFLTDINGGVTKQAGADFVNMLIGRAKKNAVFASLSVAVQQPSAIARAMTYVDPKYFVGLHHKGTWEEIQKYAPVAIVKEMGYFDTGIGRQAVEWMTDTEYEGLKEKAGAFFKDGNFRDELMSMLPGYMDKISWGRLWIAVKNETKAKHTDLDVNSEEFLQACGERFTYVIDRTQVYDSVFSRSEWMRSKDTGVKVATAFMSEPLTAYNMLYKAAVESKKGNHKFAVRTLSAYVISVVFNSLLKSIITAMRDDDEEKSFWEKYIADFISNASDDVFGMIPYVKDVISILQGYESSRMDTQLFSNIADSVTLMFDSNKSPWEKVKAILGAVGMATGLPFKNVIRDAEMIVNGAKRVLDGNYKKTTATGIKYAIVEEYDVDKIKLYKTPTLTQQTLDAYVKGDTSHYKKQRESMLEKYGGDESVVNTQLKTVLKKGYLEGDYTKNQVKRVMSKVLDMDSNEIYWTLDEWDTPLKDDESYSKYDDWDAAVSSGSNIAGVAKSYNAYGVDKKALKSRITSKFKEEYVRLYKTNPAQAKVLKQKLLNAYVVLGDNRKEKEKDIDKWVK